MKVIYDVSTLGLAQYYPHGRAGILRVAENIAHGIIQTDDCELLWYPGKSLDVVGGCVDYLKADPALSSYPLLFAGWRNLRRFLRERRYDPEVVEAVSFHALLSRWNDGWEREELKLGKRLWRRVAIYGDEIVERYFFPLDSCRFEQADIFHTPMGPIPKRAQVARRLQKFLTLYDMIPVLHPEFFTRHILDLHAGILNSLHPDDWVLCISDSTKNDFLNHTRFDPAHVFVTPLAASPDVFYQCVDTERIAQVKAKYNVPGGPYILTLNKLEPRKNIDQVIRCYSDMIQTHHINDLSLVLVGGKGWLYDKIFESLSNADISRERIVMTGYVPDADLAPLYSGAMMFVYPSFYEGFGLPPLEAMQCGVPVITSNTSSLPEVVGDAGIMINPEDEDALCQNMYELYVNDSLRDKMSARVLERAKQFSWSKCVQETITAYKTALVS